MYAALQTRFPIQLERLQEVRRATAEEADVAKWATPTTLVKYQVLACTRWISLHQLRGRRAHIDGGDIEDSPDTPLNPEAPAFDPGQPTAMHPFIAAHRQMEVVRGEAAHAHLDADARTEVIREKWAALPHKNTGPRAPRSQRGGLKVVRVGPRLPITITSPQNA